MTLPPALTRAITIRFPLRQVTIFIARERDGEGWLALAGSHGWLFGSFDEALHEGRWLADQGDRVMDARERLPNRHASETFELEIAGLHYTATVSRFADGRVAEIFLQNHKPGSQADSNACGSAIAASLALQHGCELAVLRKALLHGGKGRASTPLGQVVDAIAEQEVA